MKREEQIIASQYVPFLQQLDPNLINNLLNTQSLQQQLMQSTMSAMLSMPSISVPQHNTQFQPPMSLPDQNLHFSSISDFSQTLPQQTMYQQPQMQLQHQSPIHQSAQQPQPLHTNSMQNSYQPQRIMQPQTQQPTTMHMMPQQTSFPSSFPSLESITQMSPMSVMSQQAPQLVQAPLPTMPSVVQSNAQSTTNANLSTTGLTPRNAEILQSLLSKLVPSPSQQSQSANVQSKPPMSSPNAHFQPTMQPQQFNQHPVGPSGPQYPGKSSSAQDLLKEQASLQANVLSLLQRSKKQSTNFNPTNTQEYSPNFPNLTPNYQ
jgi:hypothetical protein